MILKLTQKMTFFGFIYNFEGFYTALSTINACHLNLNDVNYHLKLLNKDLSEASDTAFYKEKHKGKVSIDDTKSSGLVNS